MIRTIILTIGDRQRTQEKIDLAVLKLMNSIQETQFNDTRLKVSRPGKFYLKAEIIANYANNP